MSQGMFLSHLLWEIKANVNGICCRSSTNVTIQPCTLDHLKELQPFPTSPKSSPTQHSTNTKVVVDLIHQGFSCMRILIKNKKNNKQTYKQTIRWGNRPKPSNFWKQILSIAFAKKSSPFVGLATVTRFSSSLLRSAPWQASCLLQILTQLVFCLCIYQLFLLLKRQSLFAQECTTPKFRKGCWILHIKVN